MDFFLISKHQSVEENILFTSKVLYELLDVEKHVDQLFADFAKKQNISLNMNIERILYLSLTFLFSIDKIFIRENMIKRNEK